jgi:hypothetical protein
MKVLVTNGYDVSDVVARREAQRCLANAMYLKPETRKIFVDVGGCNKFVSALKASTSKRDGDDDFLFGRIGFLLTAQKELVVQRLLNDDRIMLDLVKVFRCSSFLMARF